MSNLIPLNDRVVIKKVTTQQVTEGGIFLPENVKQEKPLQGEVMAVGPGAYSEKGELIPMRVPVGAQVVFGKFSGTEVKIDGVDYLLVAEKDVLAIIQ